jgi:hypothetical protein
MTHSSNLNVQQLNDFTVLVKPEFHIISGRKKLRVEDLNLPDGVELPPEQIASLGSKKFIDPELISKFNRLRDRANRACEKIGVRFLGGYAVPFDHVDELSVELDDLVAEFGNVKTSFVRNYDDHIEDWCSANPEWESVVRRAVTPKHIVEAALSANYVLYQVNVPEGVSSERLDEQVTGLGDRVYEEIAKEAKRFVEESLSIKNGSSIRYRTDAEGVTQKALRPIKRMRDKMNGLAFLDSGIRPAVKYIDSVLSLMPEKGFIRDDQFNQLLMLSLSLTDENKIKVLGAAIAGFDDSEADVLAIGENNNALDVVEGEIVEDEADVVSSVVDVDVDDDVVDAEFEEYHEAADALSEQNEVHSTVDVEALDSVDDDNGIYSLEEDDLDVGDFESTIISDGAAISSSQASFF